MFALSLLSFAVLGTNLGLHAAGAPAERREASADAFAYKLGNLAPYHQAPWPAGISDLPADCTVDQVMLMGRHGSRYPLASELVFITNLVGKLTNHSEVIAKAKLPAGLAFLKEGYASTLGHDDLTAIGRQQLFDHGVAFKLKYPQLNATAVLAGKQDRVIESATWFAQGYFGRTWPNISATAFSTIPEDNVTVSWITPMDTCPKWQYAYGGNATTTWGNVYLPPITKRLNAALPGVGLTDADTHGALYACAYDYAAHGVSPWCGAFTAAELASFEYELDLLMDGAFGYNLPGDMGPLLGSVFVNTLISRFTAGTQPVYLEFGHDTTIDMALTALGLAKDTPALSATGPARAGRRFRTSTQVPFGAQMIWERFSCESTLKGPQIRLVLNDAPVPLAACARGAGARYGSCALADFVAANAASTAVRWGDARWNATCGSPGF